MTEELRGYLAERLAAARAGNGWLSPDGQAVYLYGSICIACYFSPDGDVIFEEYDVETDEVRYHRSGRERIAAIALAMRKHPLLRELLPVRTEEARDCAECGGQGFRDLGTLKADLLCWECCGLGWIGDVDNGR